MITKDKWEWFGHPAHFICARDCKFFMATRVGKYIVSTVGEYFPDAPVREIFAESRKIKLEGIGDLRRADYMKKIGFEEIGYDRKYETMVFKAQKIKDDYKCCEWRIIASESVDLIGYNNPLEARKGHLKLCAKWAKKQ